MLNGFFSRFFGGNSKENRHVNFQKITAKQVATDNGIEYISDANGRKLNSERGSVNKFYAGEGKYILLHPANDGMPTCPFEWYGTFNGKQQMIMDNQHSFKGITNLC